PGVPRRREPSGVVQAMRGTQSPLLSRRRGLTALWPFPGRELARRAAQGIRAHPLGSAAGGAVAAGVLAAALVAGGEGSRANG
ncbi:MAG TPA: hypothetical protein VK988_17145, partial [Acidimicrobiales bacterium]|nr:hypothetical protein [Acidimicrobiales bacterium]